MMNCNNSSFDGRLERAIGHNIHCDCISCHNQTHGKPAGSVGNGWQCMHIQANKTMTCGPSTCVFQRDQTYSCCFFLQFN